MFVCFVVCVARQAFGAGFGAFYGALREAYSNPPKPTPSDKVVLTPIKSDRAVRTMQAMGRNAAMMAMVAGIFTLGEVGALVYGALVILLYSVVVPYLFFCSLALGSL